MGFNFSSIIEQYDGFEIPDLTLQRVTSIKRKTMVEGYHVAPMYHDFRDTMVRYYLYLPFADTIELDNYKVIDKTLKIDCLVDVRTGNLKYYIFASDHDGGGTIIATAGGSCRVDFPVTATNPVAKAQQIRENSGAIGKTLLGMAKNSVSTLGGIFKSASEGMAQQGGSMYNGQWVDSGTIQNSFGRMIGAQNDINNMHINNAVSFIKTIPMAQFNLRAPSPTTFNGSYSSGTSVDDPLDFYLYRISPNIQYDEGILANYGRPCNTWATIGSQSGYIKCDDVKLTGDIPQEHKAQLINDLTRGIYHV